MLQKLQGEAPLVLDVGNALFRAPGEPANDAAKERARFVLTTMGQLGVKVMVAGHRDLNAGVAFLAGEAKKAGVQVLSANLEQDGKRVFDGAAVLTVNGLKVGLIGVTAAGGVPGVPGALGTPTLDAATAELARLGRRDLTVVLAATTWADAAQLASSLGGKVDLVLASGEPHGNLPPQRFDSGVFLLSSGSKGQAVGQLRLDLAGSGPFVDLDAVAREQSSVPFLENQVKTLEQRLALAKDAQAKKDLGATLAQMKQRVAEQKKKGASALGPGQRRLDLDWAVLDASVEDDPVLAKAALKIEPPGTVH